MIFGFKMLAYPTKEQEKLMFYYCKVSHNMWNFLVEKYKDNLPKVNSYGIVGYTPRELIEDFGENIPQRIALGVMKRFSRAVNKVYLHQTKCVKFHKFNPNVQSFYVSSRKYPIKNYKISFNYLKSQKLTSYKVSLEKSYIDKYNITEVKEPKYMYKNGNWYLVGSYVIPDVPKDLNKDVLGLDWGIKNFYTTSMGEFINYPQTIKREYYRIRKMQSILSKKEHDSSNYVKLRNKITSAYIRMENLKVDFIEKETAILSKNFHIAVENLGNWKMPYRNLRRISMTSPRQRFVNRLESKCEKNGSFFLKVNPLYTTQKCSLCGKINHVTLKDRTYYCSCGLEIDRDINASINIANEGRKILLSMGVCCTY